MLGLANSSWLSIFKSMKVRSNSKSALVCSRLDGTLELWTLAKRSTFHFFPFSRTMHEPLPETTFWSGPYLISPLST